MNASHTSLVQELRDAGVPVDDLWDLVNSRVDYPQAIPILLEWLDHRMPVTDRRAREGLVRALTTRAARPAAIPVLLREFRTAEDARYRWAVGNALSVIADASAFEAISELVMDR